MKNLYLIPTQKPSRLVRIYSDSERNNFTLKLDAEVNDSFKEYVNIYIIYDEKIVSNNWCLNTINNSIYKTYTAINFNNDTDREKWRKIILTTDQDLIADGVEAIDYDFLDWFVDNPNCDYFELIAYRSRNKMSGRSANKMSGRSASQTLNQNKNSDNSQTGKSFFDEDDEENLADVTENLILGDFEIYLMNEDGDFNINIDTSKKFSDLAYTYISKEEAKQLIAFLQKHIKS
jgi:hypothetical protein